MVIIGRVVTQQFQEKEGMQVISARTRDAFRDAFVTLSRNKGPIDELLERTGIRPRDTVHARSIGELVEAYYESVDWTDPGSYEPFLAFFVAVYERVPDSIWLHREELSERLYDDGLYGERQAEALAALIIGAFTCDTSTSGRGHQPPPAFRPCEKYRTEDS
jgi:hypothetical protein